MIRFYSIFLFFSLLLSYKASGQEAQPVTYPRLAGFAGLAHPVITFSKEGTSVNFKDFYTVAIPSGIHIWKSPKIGFSLEVTPMIRVENNISKMNNVMIHPGVLVALGNGFNFAGRVAFETSGRYGVTPILSKVLIRNKGSNFYGALPLALRFGNDQPSSLTLAVMFGVAF